MERTHLLTLAGTLGAALAFASSANAATLTVINTNDHGAGSLRSALLAAEQQPSADVVKFEIPGKNLHTIKLDRDLPTLTRPVTIKGYSQDGASQATASDPAVLKVAIDASNAMRGIDVGGDGIEIRGLEIDHAQGAGIYLEGDGNVAAGNAISSSGDDGVHVVGSGAVVGGPEPADANVISGSDDDEIDVEAGSGHVVQGNLIGTDGTHDLSFATGVRLGAPAVSVQDNVIAGEDTGVSLESDGNTLSGNLIGTNAAGSAALPNTHGIVVAGSRNTIGDGNVVSGNWFEGIELTDGASDNEIDGNLIGTDATATAGVANGTVGIGPGVRIDGADDTTLRDNVISGNAGHGVQITGQGADRNLLLGNWIGTDKTGALALGNRSGVEIEDGADGNGVGDTTLAGANTIAHNREDGVSILDGTGNSVVHNSIHDNGDLAIDLRDDGPTANDDDDQDKGPNDLQNGPEIASATATGVDWTLDTDSTSTYRLEFYANDSCNRFGVSEAQTYLGTFIAHTDANGEDDGHTETLFPAGTGKYVTMTATKIAPAMIDGKIVQAPASTSEVSPCEQAGS